MADQTVIDAEVVDDEPAQNATALAVREPGHLSVAPQVEAAELGLRLAVIKQAMDDQMIRDVDYGVIPGTKKPSLFKPGAEKLSVLFQLDIQLVNEKERGPGDHLTVTSHATVFHAPTGQRLGYGEGLCTTRESRYAKRKQERTCPECGMAAIIKGKAEFGGGWVCFKKKDGCGAKFPDGDPVIEDQTVGEIENPDLPDCWNTVIKMAEKRARVDAILSVTGASALFTQDVEDQQAAGDDGQPAAGVQAGPPFGPAADPDTDKAAKRALGALARGDGKLAAEAFQKIGRDCGGYFPAAAAHAVLRVEAIVNGPFVDAPEVN